MQAALHSQLHYFEAPNSLYAVCCSHPEYLPRDSVMSSTLLRSHSQQVWLPVKQEGADLGRGERMHAVFLDNDGDESDFPPCAITGWRPAAKTACRVYVRNQ